MRNQEKKILEKLNNFVKKENNGSNSCWLHTYLNHWYGLSIWVGNDPQHLKNHQFDFQVHVSSTSSMSTIQDSEIEVFMFTNDKYNWPNLQNFTLAKKFCTLIMPYGLWARK